MDFVFRVELRVKYGCGNRMSESLTMNEVIVQADHVHGWATEVGNQNIWNKFNGFFSGVKDSVFSHCAEIALSIDVVDFVESVFNTELNKGISVSRIQFYCRLENLTLNYLNEILMSSYDSQTTKAFSARVVTTLEYERRALVVDPRTWLPKTESRPTTASAKSL